jgi:phosphatidylinositol alpha-mannosyltransferase
MDIARVFSGDYAEAMARAVEGLHAIVSNSMEAKILLKAGAAIARIVPGGVDCEFFRPASERAKAEGGPFEIIVAGRMSDPAKGASVALKAGEILRSSGLDFHMLVTRPASPGAPPWLEERGWLERNELADLLGKASCAVAPSLWDEAFGLAWAEALASGTPVVASAVAGPAEYLRDGETALLFPPGDAQALANALLRLASDKALRERLAKAGLKLARETLTWENAALETAKAIRAALPEEMR